MLRITLIVVVVAAVVAGRLQISAAGLSKRFPGATFTVAVMVAVTFAAQYAIPNLLPLMAREPSMWQGFQIWRALTALFVQDSGIAGALFNLATLLILGTVAEKCLGSRPWLAVYFGGGIITEFLALTWQPSGAGNSIACFSLAGALTLYAIIENISRALLCVCLVSLAAAVTLLLFRDIHGLAFFTGVVCAVAVRKPQEIQPPNAPERS